MEGSELRGLAIRASFVPEVSKWKRRASLVGTGLALSLAAAAMVRFPPERYAFYPECPFHAWTGLLCPGCGGTRAIAALLRGDLMAAWQLNSLVVALLPFALAYGAVVAMRTWRGERARWPEIPAMVWGMVGAATMVFGTVRNL